jgi:hypothetical protein
MIDMDLKHCIGLHKDHVNLPIEKRFTDSVVLSRVSIHDRLQLLKGRCEVIACPSSDSD